MTMRTTCIGCNKLIPIGSKCGCRKRKATEQEQERNKELMSRRWRNFRKQIIERDEGYCQRCLIKYNIIETSNLQVHHIKPRVKYPELTYEETNCVTLCKTCNLNLGTKEQLDFLFEIEIKDDFVL